MEQHIRKPRALEGAITPPPDKSISHRSLILNSLAEGQARVTNFLTAADCLSTLSCLRALGVEIERQGSTVTVHSRGAKGFREPKEILDAGNSGTTIRLLSGLLASQPFRCIITGDASLRSRPMGRVIEPLSLMGAIIRGHEGSQRAPLTIEGGKLHGIRYRMPVASAQVKSAILLAGLFADGETVIEEPAPSRDHTERMLRAMGAAVKTEGHVITLVPTHTPLRPLTLQVPGDVSSAAFWMVAGAVHPNARIKIRGVNMNPTRSGVIDILQSMGARLIIDSQHMEGDEPTADIEVQSSRLRAVSFGGEMIPRLIDEIPVLAVAASVAEGTTVIRDAGELRVKESDRIATTARELSRLGARIEELSDGMIIKGVPSLKGNRCDSHEDHRLAMALAVAGLIAEGETIISRAEAVDISYPEFWKDLGRLCGEG